MISVHLTQVPSSAIAAFRDDGPLSRALGRLAAGQLPPLLPALIGMCVTGVLLLAGIAGERGLAIFAPMVALLLTGPASSSPHTGRLDWLVPPILRLTEYGFIAAVGFAAEVSPPLIFALLGALAFHHYDVVYRVRQGIYPPAWLYLAGLGWDGRMAIISLAALVDALPIMYALLGAGLGVLFVYESVTSWLATPRIGVAAAGLTADQGED